MDKSIRAGGERDDQGKFSTKYEPNEFLDALVQLGGSGSTKEVADKVECARRTAHYRLSDLQEAGRVTSREVGRSILWETNEYGE